MREKKKNRGLKFFAKLAGSVFFAYLIYRKVDWVAFWEIVREVKVISIPTYGVILLGGMVLSSVKWKKILAYKQKKVALGELFALYLTGSFINNFMPSFIGGDAYRAYHTGKKEKDYVLATSAVIMDRITGLFGAILLSIFFGLANYPSIHRSSTLEGVFWMICLACGALLALLGLFHAKTARRIFSAYLPEKIKHVLRIFATYADSRFMVGVIGISVAYNLIGLGLLNYVLFWGFGIAIAPLDYLSVIFLISIIASLPVSIGNIGIKEWAYVAFFGFFGVNPAASLAISLVSRAIQMLVSFGALPLYLRGRREDLQVR